MNQQIPPEVQEAFKKAQAERAAAGPAPGPGMIQLEDERLVALNHMMQQVRQSMDKALEMLSGM